MIRSSDAHGYANNQRTLPPRIPNDPVLGSRAIGQYIYSPSNNGDGVIATVDVVLRTALDVEDAAGIIKHLWDDGDRYREGSTGHYGMFDGDIVPGGDIPPRIDPYDGRRRIRRGRIRFSVQHSQITQRIDVTFAIDRQIAAISVA